ncbi:hypothetical protein [Gordonia crocea]|uniref:Secreted protein n=1 Tax=Gordonia crocea TaxID=589162 RepID=A0A7M3SV16_9ACTN|nr:hypothetical protein [Gordonia crocea]GED96490.1 hypothetical protein nbrc107697_05290 [Gordonia crocea]
MKAPYSSRLHLSALFAAVAVAGGLAVAAPDAQAAPRAVFSSSHGQIVGTATGMRHVPKTCRLDRQVRVDVDGPLSTYSNDGGMVTAARGDTGGAQITLRSKRLPPGWYNTMLVCSYRDHGFDRPEVLQSGRVFNR